MSTFRIDEFAGGRDKRPRLFYGKEKNRFKNLDNAYIAKDKKVHRRFPMRYVSGTVTTGTANGFGAISIDGVLTYFAPKTATPVVSLAGVSTAILTFDEVGGHVADLIVDAKMYNGNVVALIRHKFTSITSLAGSQYTYKIHVFDGKPEKPTFTEDAFFPTSWGPTLPLHVYRTGTLGAYVSYIPRMGIAAGKVYVSGPDGNTYFSAPSNARVWNTRTQTQILSQGEWFYWPNYDTFTAGDVIDTSTETNGVSRWIISETGTDIVNASRFTCYVLEYCDTSGTWVKFIEDAQATKTGAVYSGGAAPTVQGHYQLVDIVGSGPYGGGAVVGFRFKTPANTTPIFRFRLLAGKPPITVVSGGAWTDNHTRTAGTGTYEDATFPIGAAAVGSPSDNWSRLLLVNSPDTTVAAYVEQHTTPPATTTVIVAFALMTGYERYTNLVVGWSWEYVDAVPTTRFHTELATYVTYADDRPVTITNGYPDTTGNTSAFYVRRSAIILGEAGNGLAGFLPTATRARADGGPVTAISTVGDYIGVHYRSMTLLYAVNPNQLLDALRDTISFGTGQYTDGTVVQFYKQTILFSERGLRAFGVTISFSERADDVNIGEANEPFVPAHTTLIAASFWPYTGQYIALLTIAGTTYAYVFDYSKESKISCWSRWPVSLIPGASGPCGMSAIGPRMYIILASGGVAYFDAAAAPGQWFDDVDPNGTVTPYAYKSIAECYQNDFGLASVDKAFKSMDVVAQGETTVEFTILSSDHERTIPGVVLTDASYGSKRIRLAMRSHAVAPKFSSTDANEWILDSFALDFTPTRR